MQARPPMLGLGRLVRAWSLSSARPPMLGSGQGHGMDAGAWVRMGQSRGMIIFSYSNANNMIMSSVCIVSMSCN